MAYIIWSEFFSVGVPFLDQQHKKLFGIINEFYDAVKREDKKEKVFKTLHELIIYSEKHFKDEEKILHQSDYPEKVLSLHEKYHEKLLEDVFKITELLEKNDDDVVYKLEVFLNGWIVKHILFQDKKYEAHFLAKKKK